MLTAYHGSISSLSDQLTSTKHRMPTRQHAARPAGPIMAGCLTQVGGPKRRHAHEHGPAIWHGPPPPEGGRAEGHVCAAIHHAPHEHRLGTPCSTALLSQQVHLLSWPQPTRQSKLCALPCFPHSPGSQLTPSGASSQAGQAHAWEGLPRSIIIGPLPSKPLLMPKPPKPPPGPPLPPKGGPPGARQVSTLLAWWQLTHHCGPWHRVDMHAACGCIMHRDGEWGHLSRSRGRHPASSGSPGCSGPAASTCGHASASSSLS